MGNSTVFQDNSSQTIQQEVVEITLAVLWNITHNFRSQLETCGCLNRWNLPELFLGN